jgi:hypothetical protein
LLFAFAMSNVCIKVKLAFQSPLGGMVKRKRILTFPSDALLQEVAEVVSGATGPKALWPASFGDWLQQSGASLLICYWNESQWEPLPSFSMLKDITSDVSADEIVELLFSVRDGKCSGCESNLGFESKIQDVTETKMPDVSPLTRKPPLIPRQPKAAAQVSNSVVSTKVSTGSEAGLMQCWGRLSL